MNSKNVMGTCIDRAKHLAPLGLTTLALAGYGVVLHQLGEAITDTSYRNPIPTQTDGPLVLTTTSRQQTEQIIYHLNNKPTTLVASAR